MKDRCFMMQSKQQIFMIFIAVMLLSCFLTGCYIGAEQVPTEEMTQPEETTQATEPTETEPPAPVEMTYEEFVEKTTGCWFDASTIRSDMFDQFAHNIQLVIAREDDFTADGFLCGTIW